MPFIELFIPVTLCFLFSFANSFSVFTLTQTKSCRTSYCYLYVSLQPLSKVAADPKLLCFEIFYSRTMATTLYSQKIQPAVSYCLVIIFKRVAPLHCFHLFAQDYKLLQSQQLNANSQANLDGTTIKCNELCIIIKIGLDCMQMDLTKSLDRNGIY